MKIGELSRRTGIPARLLRYYEEQALLVPARTANGYRDYPEAAIARAGQIRGLLDFGLPIRLIKQIIPMLGDTRSLHLTAPPAALVTELERERDRVHQLVSCLAKNRDGLDAYLATIDRSRTRERPRVHEAQVDDIVDLE